jgi:hypothetical protein
LKAFAGEFCVSNSEELQNALAEARNNGEADTIKVVQETYADDFVVNMEASEAGLSLTLLAGYTDGCANRQVDPANTVLDGGNTHGVLYVDGSGDVTMEGFTVQNGHDSRQGAGVSIGVGGDINLSNNVIKDNVTVFGEGGGAWLRGRNVTLIGNVITGNSTVGSGGGAHVESHSESGESGNVTITNNLIVANKSGHQGGGLYGFVRADDTGHAVNVILTNNTIFGNMANEGGGIYVLRWKGCVIDVFSNIIWGNSAVQGPDILMNWAWGTASGYNNDYSGLLGSWTNSDKNINSAPLFLASGHWDDNSTPEDDSDDFWVGVGGDYRLTLNSPCIDTGSDSAPGLPLIDFEGDARILDGNNDGSAAVDIGADEYNSSVIDSDGDGVPDGDDECPEDPNKTEPGVCGCGKADDADEDQDNIPDCLDDRPEEPIEKGDINNDGEVDLRDAILCLQAVLDGVPTSSIFIQADEDGDGKIGLQDITCILHRTCLMR